MNLTIKTASQRPDGLHKAAATIADVISYAIADSDLGKALVARSAAGVCSILLGDDAETLRADLARRFSRSTLVACEAMVSGHVASLLRYISKPSEGLELPLDMRGTPFQIRVWRKLRTIPVGRTVSYTDLAQWVGPRANARAVASACSANPIALAIPCHRVVRSSGDLAGYRWGIARKRALIQREAMG